MLTAGRWDDLSPKVGVSIGEIDIGLGLARLLDRHQEHPDASLDYLGASLPDTWTSLAQASLDAQDAMFAWASPSTLLAAAPSSIPQSEFLSRSAQEAQSGGATMPAAIYASHGPKYWARYREWFGLADDIDQGTLRAVAFYNPAIAARLAVRACPPKNAYSYDDERRTLEVTNGDVGFELDVEVSSFAGLMRGFLPEQTLAVALSETSSRLARLEELARSIQAKFPLKAVRFAGDILALLINEHIVLDPPGTDFIRSSGALPDTHDRDLARAVSDPFTTPCACGEQRRVQAMLRKRAEAQSFRSDVPETDYLFRSLGHAHCVIFGLTCSHVTSHPAAPEWGSAGWTIERCEQVWLRSPLSGELVAARTSGWLYHAAVAHAIEVGAMISAPALFAFLAVQLGFRVGQLVTAYVPTANVIFLTDEPITSETVLRTAFEEGVLSRLLENEGLPLGPNVDYLAQIRVDTPGRFDIALRELDLTPEEVGSFE